MEFVPCPACGDLGHSITACPVFNGIDVETQRKERHTLAALAIARKHVSESQAWRDVIVLLEGADGAP